MKTLDVVFFLVLWTIVLCALLAGAHSQQPPNQKQAYMICEGRCLKSIGLADNAQLVTPMVDGKADYSKGVLYHTKVTVDHSLERIELR